MRKTGFASTVARLSIVVIAASLSGCVFAPGETKREKASLERAGEPYRRPFEHRELPELPTHPEWSHVLRRASLANGDLEAAYYKWAAAVHKIQQAGGYPNTPLSIGFEQMIDGGFGGFDDTTVSIGPDAMENLAFPTKVYQAAKVALNDARAEGQRFIAARLELQRKVINAWYDYALQAERIRIQQSNLALLRLVSDTAVNRVQAGAQQQELLRAEIEYRMAEDELKTLEAELPRMRAMLNAMMGREADAPLEPPAQIPPSRPLRASDAELLALAAENNADLAALAAQVKGRRDALQLAKLQYIPDFNPFGGVTGTASQFVGLGVSIPTFLPEVESMVKQARAELREMLAMYRQTKFDRAAGVVAALYTLRNSERQVALFDQGIIPVAQRVVDNVRQAYSTGTGSFIDLIEAQRTLLEVRLTVAEARSAREKSLADLEELVGVSIESLQRRSATQPTTQPATTQSSVRAFAGERGDPQ
jgi:cobalt-zinc-cadmium efflux system outer membrane protein